MRVGVIGLGSMGRNHARVFSEIAILSDVCDVNMKLRDSYPHVRWSSLASILLKHDDLDAVSIATPTNTHFKIAQMAIEAGIPVLVEKPLSANVSECEQLVELAVANDVFLAVGHVGRYNPAIVALKERWSQLGTVLQIILERMGPRPMQPMDTGVIMDLTVHDIDLLTYLTNDRIKTMVGHQIKPKRAKHEVSAATLMMLDSGIVATLMESWTSPIKIRRVTVYGSKGMMRADLLHQSLTFYQNNYTAMKWREMEAFFGVSEGDITTYKIEHREPLRDELLAFLQKAETGKGDCPTGEDGLRAVESAEELERKLLKSAPCKAK